jgi:dipeptidyl aminopeptidase/acylaminoacyl peptidase
MSRFDTTEGEPHFSPDKKLFSVVTSRGIIATNSIESTLRVFRSDEVRRFLKSNRAAQAPQGRPITKLARIPKNNYTVFYAPIISNVRWQDDSKALLYLGQNSRGERQLYRVDISSGVVRELTSKGYDVSQYALRGNTIVYVAAPEKQSTRTGTAINVDAFNVTGVPLASFLPSIDDAARNCDLWVISNGKKWRVKKEREQPLHLANHFPEVLSISPDRKAVVVLLPSDTIPASWDAYEPTNPYLRLRPSDPSATDRSNFARPMQYVALELDTGKTRFIMNGPHGYALGYIQKDVAIWSTDGKRLLLTNTFLPLNDASGAQPLQRLKPCACAIVDFGVHSTSCIAWSRYTPADKSSLVSAAFGKIRDEVILGFSTAPNGSVQEVYEREGSGWRRAETREKGIAEVQETVGEPPSRPVRIIVEIRETPNDPPALYATDPTSGRSRKLWDPNPKLASFNLGEVTEFHWVDRTGYEWAGQLVKPPDYVAGSRYPLVIQPYGFSKSFVTDGFFPTASAARALAAVGMMVLQMPRRTDHNGTAQEALDQVLGFEAAIDRLTSDGLIIPERVGIVGFSRTCYHVESALVADPTRFAAATIADGMDGSYLQYLYSVGDSTTISEDIYGAKPFGPGLTQWVHLAPGFNLDKVQTPLRIEAIGFASILTEWETYASLFSQGKPVDLIYFPLGDHLLQKPLERMASQQGNVDWFRFWLKGEEDHDSSKRNQYGRWRKMREQLHSKNGS